MNDELELLLSRVKCNLCEDILESLYHWDHITCECGATTLDGGHESFNRWQTGTDSTDMSITSADSFEVIRTNIKRGSRGPNGDQELTWVVLCDMDDDYLMNLIEYVKEHQGNTSNKYYKYYLMEKDYRGL